MRVPRQKKDELQADECNDDDDDEEDTRDTCDEDEPEIRSASSLPRENGSGSAGFKERSSREQLAYLGESIISGFKYNHQFLRKI